MDMNLDNFYRLFWGNEVCQNVFLLHKELLLEKNSLELEITDYYLQRIVISNSLTSKNDVDEHLIFRQENKFTSLLKKLAESRKKYLNEERIEKYALNRFGKTINLIKNEIEDEGLLGFIIKLFEAIDKEENIIDVFKKYKMLPDNVSSNKELEEYVLKELTDESKKFLKKQNFSHMFLSIDDVSHFYNSILRESLINGYQQNVQTLIDKDNFKSRLKLFDKLYEIKILQGGKFKSYFECIECPPDTFNGFISCNIMPSKIKIKCPQCKRTTNYLVPYFIVDELFDHITHADGLLFFAVQYLLEAYNIRHQKSANLENGNELDFVLLNSQSISCILELKMFRNDKSDKVKAKNLKGAISQMKKSKEILINKNENYSFVPSFLITNVTELNIINSVKSSLRNDLKSLNIQIFTPNQLHQFIKDELRNN